MPNRSEFMNWRAGERYRLLVEKIKREKGLRSNAEVLRQALIAFAEREGVKV